MPKMNILMSIPSQRIMLALTFVLHLSVAIMRHGTYIPILRLL